MILYTAGDLAAVMALNVDLKVLSANGLYDFVTPFYQTVIDLQQMPLEDQKVRQNLSARFYPSGHMVYLDGGSRRAQARSRGDVRRDGQRYGCADADSCAAGDEVRRARVTVPVNTPRAAGTVRAAF